MWTPEPLIHTRALHGQTVVVTGATRGIGKETARWLARMGARTLIVGRDAAKGARVVRELQAETGNLEIKQVVGDLARLREVRRVAHEIRRLTPHLDVLVNNVGTVYQQRTVSEEGIEQTWALNHLGPMQLTLDLLDQLRASRGGRVVNVNSNAHQQGRIDFGDLGAERGYRSFQRYRDSKLANLLFTRAQARRLEGSGVTVNAAHPGFVPENFPIPPSLGRSLTLFLARPWSRTSREGALTSAYLAASAEVQGVSGLYFESCRAVVPAPAARDGRLAESLWAVSLRQIGAVLEQNTSP